MIDYILKEKQQERLVESFKEAVEFWSEFDLREVVAPPVQEINLEKRTLLRSLSAVFPQIVDLMSGRSYRAEMNKVMFGISTLAAEKITFHSEAEDVLTVSAGQGKELREDFANIIMANTKGLVTILEERFPNGVSDELYERQVPHHKGTVMSALMNTAKNRNLIPQDFS